MRKLDWKKAAFLAMILFGAVPLAGCEKENSAGGIGKKIDNAVDPRGPAQKIGDKIDNAVDK
jgi:hypothetical protein